MVSKGGRVRHPDLEFAVQVLHIPRSREQSRLYSSKRIDSGMEMETSRNLAALGLLLVEVSQERAWKLRAEVCHF